MVPVNQLPFGKVADSLLQRPAEIDADAIREFRTAWKQVADDPVKAQEEPYEPMKQRINQSLGEALEMKANVMVESILRRYDEIAEMAQRMKDTGHRVELEVAANSSPYLTSGKT